MAYVNEYASDEVIEKYKLNEVWDRYHPHEKGERFWARKPELTVDHSSGNFLMVVNEGPVSSGTQFKFLLSIGGEAAFVYLNLVEGSSLKFTDRPFRIVWDFVTIDIPEQCSLDNMKIIKELKQAVSVFGYSGARKQIPKTVVQFNF